jgi:nickel/cobalt transporter (NiCoT) family protein
VVWSPLLNLSGSFWNWLENIDINFLGFVIVGMFLVTWVIALSVWRYARIEEKWGVPVTGSPAASDS